MSTTPASNYALVSEQEYFRREAATELRLEYYDGVIVTLQGSKPEHSLIAMSLGAAVWNRLRGRPCAVYGPDLRVKAGLSGSKYFHPDLTVICGGLQRYAGNADTATNPLLVAEVLSESTERRDRVVKMSAYFELPSMREYLLVWQKEPIIESYYRDEQGEWRIDHVDGLDVVLKLRSLGCEIPLSEIYGGLEFEPREAYDGLEDPPRVAEDGLVSR